MYAAIQTTSSNAANRYSGLGDMISMTSITDDLANAHKTEASPTSNTRSEFEEYKRKEHIIET
jgi:hypothetical protein